MDPNYGGYGTMYAPPPGDKKLDGAIEGPPNLYQPEKFGTFYAPPPGDKELSAPFEGPPDLYPRTTEEAKENEEKAEQIDRVTDLGLGLALMFGGVALADRFGPTIGRALRDFNDPLPMVLDPVFVEDDDMPDLVDLALP